MGCRQSSVLSKWEVYETQFPVDKAYMGAGCMWVSRTHMLAGIHTYQSRSHKPKKISGFGGKAKSNEVWWQTAFRETVEEIFDVKQVPNDLLIALKAKLIPMNVLVQPSPSYLTLVFPMEDMNVFLKLCKRFLKQSSLYQSFPVSAEEVVFNRGFASRSEISHILFWPLHFTGSHFRISSDLQEDLGKYNHVQRS